MSDDDRTPGPAALPSSGEQVRLAHGDQEAVVVTVGAALRTYRAAGRDLVDGYAEGTMADGGRGQTLVPWPNRVRDGRWTWRGVERRLALTEPTTGHAIHGLVRWLGWQVEGRSADAVTLACTSWPQPGYPWALQVRVRYAVGSDGLEVRQEVVNRDADPAPVAAGAHPYVTAGTPLVDDAMLTVPASELLDCDERQIPTGRREVDGTGDDFRAPRRIGAARIDRAYTGLQRDGDGLAVVRLEQPGRGHGVELWCDEAYRYLQVYTGDTLPDPSRRRRGLAVEPMTAPPNALATGEDLVVLEPGESWSGRWGIRPVGA